MSQTGVRSAAVTGQAKVKIRLPSRPSANVQALLLACSGGLMTGAAAATHLLRAQHGGAAGPALQAPPRWSHGGRPGRAPPAGRGWQPGTGPGAGRGAGMPPRRSGGARPPPLGARWCRGPASSWVGRWSPTGRVRLACQVRGGGGGGGDCCGSRPGYAWPGRRGGGRGGGGGGGGEPPGGPPGAGSREAAIRWGCGSRGRSPPGYSTTRPGLVPDLPAVLLCSAECSACVQMDGSSLILPRFYVRLMTQ